MAEFENLFMAITEQTGQTYTWCLNWHPYWQKHSKSVSYDLAHDAHLRLRMWDAPQIISEACDELTRHLRGEGTFYVVAHAAGTFEGI